MHRASPPHVRHGCSGPAGISSGCRGGVPRGVSEAAGKWGDQMFKRLWHTGCNVDFYNVDWRSDIGSSANYHQNASNAFVVAANLIPLIKEIPGEKVIMAHSLGNMVASAAIADWGLSGERYFMLNAAVPIPSSSDRKDTL